MKRKKILFLIGVLITSLTCSLAFVNCKTYCFRKSILAEGIACSKSRPPTEVTDLLGQDFYLSSRDNDFFIFNSGDGKYRLKILIKKESAKHILSKYILANERLKTRSTLLFINDLKLNLFVNLHLNLGLKKHVNLGKYVFVIERQAKKANETLPQLVGREEMYEAGLAVHSILDLIHERIDSGFTSASGTFGNDIGFIDGKAVDLAPAALIENPLLENSEDAQQALAWEIGNFRRWIEKNHPRLISIVDERFSIY